MRVLLKNLTKVLEVKVYRILSVWKKISSGCDSIFRLSDSDDCVVESGHNLDYKVLKQSLKPLCEDVIWVTLEGIASDQSI